MIKTRVMLISFIKNRKFRGCFLVGTSLLWTVATHESILPLAGCWAIGIILFMWGTYLCFSSKKLLEALMTLGVVFLPLQPPWHMMKVYRLFRARWHWVRLLLLAIETLSHGILFFLPVLILLRNSNQGVIPVWHAFRLVLPMYWNQG